MTDAEATAQLATVFHALVVFVAVLGGVVVTILLTGLLIEGGRKDTNER